jgi:hypothetical protein
MEQNPSSDVNIHSSGQEIDNLLWNAKVTAVFLTAYIICNNTYFIAIHNLWLNQKLHVQCAWSYTTQLVSSINQPT